MKECRACRPKTTLKTNVEQILQSQNNKCAICQEELTIAIAHRTLRPNKMHGFLCHVCREVLDLVNYDPKILKKAAEYLERINESK